MPNAFEQSQGWTCQMRLNKVKVEFLLGREVTRVFIWRQRGCLDAFFRIRKWPQATQQFKHWIHHMQKWRWVWLKFRPCWINENQTQTLRKSAILDGSLKKIPLFLIFNFWTAVWTKCALSLLGNFCVLAKAYSDTMTFWSDNLNSSISSWFSWEKCQPNAHHRHSTTCTYVCMLYTYVCMYVYMYICMHICM